MGSEARWTSSCLFSLCLCSVCRGGGAAAVPPSNQQKILCCSALLCLLRDVTRNVTLSFIFFNRLVFGGMLIWQYGTCSVNCVNESKAEMLIVLACFTLFSVSSAFERIGCLVCYPHVLLFKLSWFFTILFKTYLNFYFKKWKLWTLYVLLLTRVVGMIPWKVKQLG